ADPKSIALLSAAVQRLEQAESLSFKREQAIRKEVAQQAAETAEKVVMQAGVSKATVDQLKMEILGIA
ncbi:phage protein Gp27 family protein, partial [Avibacterium paragallinarum]